MCVCVRACVHACVRACVHSCMQTHGNRDSECVSVPCLGPVSQPHISAPHVSPTASQIPDSVYACKYSSYMERGVCQSALTAQHPQQLASN